MRLPTDDQGCIVAGGLPELDVPAIVCLQVGNVNSGASDPFAPLIDWAHSQGAWVHIDGAFGLWAAACPELTGEVAGAAAADSWATDAHKWLNTTYNCGIALVRDGRGAAGRDAGRGLVPAARQREGTCGCGPTMWCGRRAMRISISNWAITQTDVDRSVAAVLAAAQQASAHH